MDHAQIQALIAALSGAPQSDPFAGLRSETQKPGSVVSIEACPRSLPGGAFDILSKLQTAFRPWRDRAIS